MSDSSDEEIDVDAEDSSDSEDPNAQKGGAQIHMTLPSVMPHVSESESDDQTNNPAVKHFLSNTLELI